MTSDSRVGETRGVSEPLVAHHLAHDTPRAALAVAGLAVRRGADGLVISGHDVAALHARWAAIQLGGPRRTPRWLTAGGSAPSDDQRRIVTPAATLAAGASHLVVARPIITHRNPAQAVRLTAEEVAAEGRPAERTAEASVDGTVPLSDICKRNSSESSCSNGMMFHACATQLRTGLGERGAGRRVVRSEPCRT